MPTIPKYDPPAMLDDFDAIPGKRDDWNKWISDTFDKAIDGVKGQLRPGDISQYYNET